MSNLYQDWKRGPSQTPSAHEQYIWGAWRALGTVYQYDAAEDGPECEIITRILAAHPHFFPWLMNGERRALEYSRYLDVAARLILLTPFACLSLLDQNQIRQIVSQKVSAMEGLGLL